jgi:mono/diheme cytochrome c family protein
MKMVFIRFLPAVIIGALTSAPVLATPDLANGKTIDQQKCYACHAKKTGFGNGDMIYTRSDSKVKSVTDLKRMVSLCNTELRLDLFPEDEADVSAYLSQQFYKFKP